MSRKGLMPHGQPVEPFINRQFVLPADVSTRTRPNFSASTAQFVSGGQIEAETAGAFQRMSG
jgi:hypothetical protein